MNESATGKLALYGTAARSVRSLHGATLRPPEAIVVAASTGGLQALSTLFSQLGKQIAQVPVFIVLHMPPHFNSVIATQLAKISGCPTHVAGHGEVAKRGHIYFDPGDRHLTLKDKGLSVSMNLSEGPAVNFCRPSADVLFNSAATVYGASAVAIVLSGMGNDGCEGARSISAAGGLIVVQDKDSSAVWGMPGAVVEAGIADKVFPIDAMADFVGRVLAAGHAGAVA